MYFANSIDVSMRIEDIRKYSYELPLALFGKDVQEVVVEVIDPYRWRLLLYDTEGNLHSITSGSFIKIYRPMSLYRVCSGDIVVSFTQDPLENLMYLHRKDVFCMARVSNGFCSLHKRSDYSKYLSYVFGLSNTKPDVGLAQVPHMVYILSLGGSNVKVGIANVMKNLNRIFEQIFVYATPVAFVEDVARAREIEKMLAGSKIRDRVRVSERIEQIKNVNMYNLETHLTQFVLTFVRQIKPLLISRKIVNKDKPLPVIRFSDKYFENIAKTYIVHEETRLNSIEGYTEVIEYSLGGITISINNRRFFIPYYFIRDKALNIEIVK
ncbi:MAG: DUF2797 domain-containing protein [Ignisphaera sp.]